MKEKVICRQIREIKKRDYAVVFSPFFLIFSYFFWVLMRQTNSRVCCPEMAIDCCCNEAREKRQPGLPGGLFCYAHFGYDSLEICQ